MNLPQHKTRRRAGVLAAQLSLCLSPALFCPYSQAETRDIDDEREQLQNIRSQIERSEENIRQAEDKKHDIQADLKEAEKEISYLGRRLHLLQRDYDLQEIRWRELQAIKISREKLLDIERQRLEELLRAAYKIDRHGGVRLLLNQEDPALFSRMMTYYDYFSQQRVEQIKRIKQRLAELKEAQHVLQLQSRTLQRLRLDREQKLATLSHMKVQKQLVLNDIRASIDNEGQQLNQLRKDEQALTKIIQSLTELLSDIPGFATRARSFADSKGHLPWPSEGDIAVRFGSARGESGKRWSGVVLDTARGSEVTAVARGRVAFSDWLRGYGLLLIIDHGEGYMSLYGHNESVYKDTGEWVESGEVIAIVGDSGGQSYPGLYFEIRRDGKPMDPVKWCATNKSLDKG